jgi:hypothetical protein
MAVFKPLQEYLMAFQRCFNWSRRIFNRGYPT